MKRKRYTELLKWKEERADQCAVLIDGARRVGKSYIAEAFAKAEYKSYILIDFNRADEDIRNLFVHDLGDLDTFFLYLSTYYNVQLYPHESLIIFDEVQLFPRARAAIKYLVADGRYHFLETGSLMSIRKNVQDIVIPSEEHHINLYPMDFEEFLWAVGNDTLMDLVRSRFHERKAMGDAMHRKAMNLFRQYMIVGGMPQAVQKYAESRDFNQVDLIKRDILALYRADMAKHAKGYEKKIERIFNEIPSQLRKRNKKFRFSSLGKDARFRNYQDAVFWLDDAKIINICCNSTGPDIGPGLDNVRPAMKFYMEDTGLLISHAFDEKDIADEELYKKLLFNKLEVNQGMLTENIVAQMLRASGHRLYFYSSPSKANKDDRMEIDFLIAKDKITDRHNISPIEVKSGKNYSLISLRKFIAKYKEQTDIPYVLHGQDLKEENGILFLPFYMTPLL